MHFYAQGMDQQEELDNAHLIKDFGLNPKINQKPLKNFKHVFDRI